jgi:hypothetical protein
MELNVRLVTRPWPDPRTKVLIIVILIVAVMVAWDTGCGPVAAILMTLGAGLADSRVGRELITGGAPAVPPGTEAGSPA